MEKQEIIVVGASAGGVPVLRELLSGVPADLPAAIFVVLHIPPGDNSSLPQILDRAGPLHATAVVDGAPIQLSNRPRPLKAKWQREAAEKEKHAEVLRDIVGKFSA